MAFKKMDFNKINDLASQLNDGYPSIIDGIGRLYLKAGEINNLRFLHASNFSIPVLYHTVWSPGSNGRSNANRYLCDKMFSDDDLAACNACMDVDKGINDVKAVRHGKLFLVFHYDRIGKVYNKSGIVTPVDTLYVLFSDDKNFLTKITNLEVEYGPINNYNISIQTVKTGQKSWEVDHTIKPDLEMVHADSGPRQQIKESQFDYSLINPEVIPTLGGFPLVNGFQFDASKREHLQIIDEFAELMVKASGMLDMNSYKTPKPRPMQQPAYPQYPQPLQQGQYIPPQYPQQMPMYPQPMYGAPQQGYGMPQQPVYPQQNPMYQAHQQPMQNVTPPMAFGNNAYAAPPGVQPNPNYQHSQQEIEPPYSSNDPWITN